LGEGSNIAGKEKEKKQREEERAAIEKVLTIGSKVSPALGGKGEKKRRKGDRSQKKTIKPCRSDEAPNFLRRANGLYRAQRRRLGRNRGTCFPPDGQEGKKRSVSPRLRMGGKKIDDFLAEEKKKG